MAVKSGFFMSVNGDRKYDASFFAEYFSSFIGNGVFPNPSTNLQVVEGNNMQTVVKPGKGWINGYYVHNDSDFILQHDVADGVLKRIDRVVLQWNYLTRQIVIVLKKGALSSSPVAPALVRNTDYYELALADVLISNGITRITQAAITDQRLNSALCGVVTQTVKTVDTTTLFNQYQSWINQEKARFENDVNSWLANEQLDFETWRTSAEQSFNLWLQQEQTDFRAWYQSLQDLLDENIAATLTSKVTILEEETSGIKQELTTHLAESASTTVKGHVQLSDSTTSTSTSLAATANAVKKVNDVLIAHAADYVRNPAFAVTSGTGAAYTVTLDPKPTAYANGLGIDVYIHTNNIGACTININNLGAIPLKKSNGEDFEEGDLKSGQIYNFRKYDSNFIQVVKGGGGSFKGFALSAADSTGVISSGVANENDLMVYINETAPKLRLLRYDETVAPKLTKILDLANLESADRSFASVDFKNNYIIACSDTTGYLATLLKYDASNQTLTSVSSNNLGSAQQKRFVKFLDDGEHFVCGLQGGLRLFKRNGDTLPTTPTSSYGLSGAYSDFDLNGIYHVTARLNDRGVGLGKLENNSFQYLSNFTIGSDSSAYVKGVTFSPDGQYVAVGHEQPPFFTLLKRQSDTLVKVAEFNVGGNGSTGAKKPLWHKSGEYILIPKDSAPFLTILKFNKTTETLEHFQELALSSSLGIGGNKAINTSWGDFAFASQSLNLVTELRR